MERERTAGECSSSAPPAGCGLVAARAGNVVCDAREEVFVDVTRDAAFARLNEGLAEAGARFTVDGINCIAAVE